MNANKINLSNSPKGRINGSTIASLYRNYLRQKLQNCKQIEIFPNENLRKRIFQPIFKEEIEMKFNNSITNKKYHFPRKEIKDDNFEDQQLADVTVYNLSEQNNRGRAVTTYLKSEGDEPEEFERKKMVPRQSQHQRNKTENYINLNQHYIIKQIYQKMPPIYNFRFKTELDEKLKNQGFHRQLANNRKLKLK